MALFNRIQNLCGKTGITQTELEKQLGFGKGTISKWSGKTIPAADKLKKVADFFDVSMEYLMTGEEEEESYYADRETDELYEAIQNNSDIKFLLSASRDMKKEDLDFVVNLVKRMKGIED